VRLTAIRLLTLLALAGLLPPAVALPPGSPEFVPRAEAPAPRHHNLELVSVLSAGGVPFDGTTFTLLREEPAAFGKTRLRTIAFSGPQARAGFRVAPGRYRVQARNGAVTIDQIVDVPAGRHHDVELNLNAGQLRLEAWLSDDGEPAEQAWFQVYRTIQDAYGRAEQVQVAGNGYAEAANFLLPAGDYVAEARFGDATASQAVSVVAGLDTRQTLDLAAGLLTVQLSSTDAAGLNRPAQLLVELADTSGEEAAWTEFTRATASDATTFVLPAGRYRLTARTDQATTRTELTVNPGQRLEQTMALDAAKVRLTARLGDEAANLLDTLFWLLPADEAPKPTLSTGKARGPTAHAEFTVAPGSYRAVARSESGTGEARVTLTPGVNNEIVIALDAGRAKLKLKSPVGHADPHTWFSVYRLEQREGGERRVRVVNSGYYPELNVILPTGDYLVQARGLGVEGQQRFAVASGELTTVAIVATR
jgi:hypothetical protein